MKRLTILAVVAWGLGAILLATTSTCALADTVNVGDRSADSGSSDDTFIWSGAAWDDGDWGAYTPLILGWYPSASARALLRFDLSFMDPDDTITAATLHLVCAGVTGGGVTPRVFGIMAANEDADFGNGTGSNAINEACWKYKSRSGTNWAGSQGLSTSGTDYYSTNYGTFAKMTSIGAKSLSLNSTGITYLNTKVGTDAAELIIGVIEGATSDVYVTIASDDAVTDSYKPRLALTYTPPSSSVSQVIMIQCFD